VNKHIIAKFSSKYNGDIEVVKGRTGYSVVVDEITQSGPDIEALWSESFEKLIPTTPIRSVLILGFGTGSIMTPLKKRWPQALPTAVEIDQTMIKIARSYFPENLIGVALSKHDGRKYIARLEKKLTFDLLIVDCYIGDTEPGDMKTLSFLQDLKKVARHVLFNQLFLPDKKTEMHKIEFLKALDAIYPVKALKLPYNIVISF